MNNLSPISTFSNGLPECLAARAESERPNRTEVAALIRTGKQFLANGDLVAARIALKRAADSCDTDAAYSLGASYDPRILSAFGQRSAAEDGRAARAWYERAKNLGSAEASDQLKRLRAHR